MSETAAAAKIKRSLCKKCQSIIYKKVQVDLSKLNPVSADIFTQSGKDRASFQGKVKTRSCGIYFESRKPEERSGHRMLCDRDYLYVVGGFSNSPTAHLFESESVLQSLLLKEIWRFNLLCDKWEKVDMNYDDFPREMASFACELFLSSLCSDTPSGSNFTRAYMFGGTSFPFGDQPSDRVQILRRVPDRSFHWQQLNTTGHTPIRQYGSSIVFHRGVLYLIGGTTGHIYNSEIRSLSRSCQRTSSEVWEWKLLADGAGLIGRYRHETVVVDDDILIIGGGNTQWVADLDKIPAFDTRTNRLKTYFTYPDSEHGYPMGRMCHACVQYNGKIYILGGCSAVDMETESASLFDDVWELNTSSWKWKKLPTSLTLKMCFHGATDGCIYIFGGALDGKFRTRCNLLQRMWLQPPSLQYFAQRAVLASLPRLFEKILDSLTLSDPQKLFKIAYGYQNDKEREFGSFFNNQLLFRIHSANPGSVQEARCRGFSFPSPEPHFALFGPTDDCVELIGVNSFSYKVFRCSADRIPASVVPYGAE
ncbi:unnamed protein product [Enterobius vermicularis]|uniref:Kelch domain-containing protein 10 n=1 Tax=Enterobius vermicularis TaxID=51028 RepID=A0A158QAL5_ENTVE|nr:unnamed protein product [Enterobius vermicularis]